MTAKHQRKSSRPVAQETLEEAFIAHLKEAIRSKPSGRRNLCLSRVSAPAGAAACARDTASALARAFSYTLREALELRHDRVRLVMALFGSLILMLIMGYGITMDVNDLRYAVLDRDQTTLSQNYCAEPGRLALLYRAAADCRLC